MNNKNFYNEILIEHNRNPIYKTELQDANLVLEGVNPTCGDQIKLQLKVEDNIIVDGAFSGDGCAISQASVDIMLDLIIGKSKDEALNLANIFMNMIRGEVSEEDLELLAEGQALQDISHMPARVKCAVLGWHTLKEIFEHKE